MAISANEIDRDPKSPDYGYPLPIIPVDSATLGPLPAAPPNSLAASPILVPTVSVPPNLTASAPVPIPATNATQAAAPGHQYGQTLQVPGTASGTTLGNAPVLASSTAAEQVSVAVIHLTLAPGSPGATWNSTNNTPGAMTPVGGGSTTTTATTTWGSQQLPASWSFTNVPPTEL